MGRRRSVRRRPRPLGRPPRSEDERHVTLPDTHPYRNAYAYLDADCHPHSYAHPDADCYPHSDAYHDAYPNWVTTANPVAQLLRNDYQRSEWHDGNRTLE